MSSFQRTNSVELSTPLEPTSCVGTRFPSTLRDPKLHYRIHKSSPLVPVLSQTIPVDTTPSYLYKIHLKVIHPPMSCKI
jgi:hypothetical protein